MPSWKVPSALPEWLEKFFYIEDPVDPVTGDLLPPGPIRLFPHQRRILTAMTERDAEGKFRWTTLLYSAVKKSGKSRCAAGIVAWMAAQNGPYAECYVMANDGKQGDDRLLTAVGKANNLNPKLGWEASKRRITLPDGSFIEAIPVDPTGESGSNPTCTVVSELWGYSLQHKERFWAAMTISPARRGRSLRIVETYAGYEGESPTLERLYEQGVTLGKRHPDFPDLPVYINESAGLIAYWDEECYDDQTEVYTSEGWKFIRDVRGDEQILSADPDGMQLEWVDIADVVCYPYDGELIRFHNKRLDICVTPNHNMLICPNPSVKSWDGRWVFDTADNCAHKRKVWALPRAAIWKGQSQEFYILGGKPVSPELFATFCGLFLSDGNANIEKKSGRGYVWISQKNKVEEFAKGLSDMPFRVHQFERTDGSGTRFCISSQELATQCLSWGRGARNKRIPDEIKNMSTEHIGIFLEAFCLGDGYRTKSKEATLDGRTFTPKPRRCYYTSSKQLADGLTELILKIGLVPGFHVARPAGSRKVIKGVETFTRGPSYHITECTNSATARFNKKSKGGLEVEHVPYSGSVYCVNLDKHHVLWVRRNGKAGFSGNSRMPWQTDRYYAQEASLLPHNEFLRLHRNQWVRSEDVFVPVAWWDSLKEDLPPLQKGEKIIIGADAAVSGACFGLVAVTRHPDPKRKGTDVAIRLSRKWAPPRGGKIDFAAKDGPEETVREWAKDYRVLEVAYDQYQLHRTATQMNQERVCFWKPFGQQTDRLISDSQLYHLIRDGRLAHDGNTDLREHLQHCNAKTAVGEDTKMRIVQRNANSPIDLMVAAGMAAKRCLELRM